MQTQKTRFILSLLAAALTGVILSGCSSSIGASSTDLMTDITPVKVQVNPVDDKFTSALADFSVDLLKQTADDQQNCLVSPLSAELALAMTANGASGHTLSQMEQVLCGSMPINDLNAVLPGFAEGLPNTDNAKFHFANSIWCNSAQGVNIQKDFLQTNANYYGAGVFSAPMNGQTVKDINAWVNQNTDGMIPNMLSQLDSSTAMVLINALAFDAKWASPYYSNNVDKGTFTDADGTQQTASFMHSDEYTYLDDGMATGFEKSYDSDSYRFAALLPNDGVSMSDYLQSLTGEKLMDTLNNAQSCTVYASLPKFSFSYSTSLNDALSTMGMADAFSPDTADFSKMGTMNGYPLYIDKVLQKTFIDVTEQGTRAGAATAVVMYSGAAMPTDPKTVTLDRPFVFAIIDSKTSLPLFLGVVNSVEDMS